MDPSDNLELILESTIKKRNVKLGVEKGMHLASVYLCGIENQIDAFEDSLALFLQQMKSISLSGSSANGNYSSCTLP